ncbi:MAG: cyclic nucleotide-binding domain-containing protein [Treponema sp.]|jgi:CRP-like cAMP-binding protein|nr:cyclic nucleotide-binding domain-containing protein [Treponema sp.]
MPKPFQYHSGSLIYFQGDPADKIFILQNGKVSLVYQDIESGADIRDPVQPGEFFGVKSAMGRFPREENAIAMAETTIMAFTVPEFEAVASANSRIIMKMLKVFSNQLRRIHRQVSKLMEKEEAIPADGLFHVGEYYLKNKRFSQAKYVFSRYLTYYPTGKNAAEAEKNLGVAENSLTMGGGRYSAAADDDAPPADTPQAAAPPKGPTGGMSKAYRDAIDLISQEKFQEALVMFKLVVDANVDPDLTVRSTFEIGHCMFLLEKYEECLKFLTAMLTRYAKHPDLKDAVFIMGQCNEKIGRKAQAAAFYKKALSMCTDENDGTAEKVKRALSALGA